MKHIALFVMLLCMLTPCIAANAQKANDEVQSLGEILNPRAKNSGSELGVKERSNLYFRKCMATESLAFDNEEKEILCACTSAKLGEIITGEEFVELYKDTKAGANARMKVITYAYTECMNYAIKSKVYKDCRVLPLMGKIKHGKDFVCECLTNQHEDLVNKGASRMIMDGVKHDPMTLNPLESYFTTDSYYNTLENYVKICRARLMYNKHN